jgi:COMPASS component SWD3
VNGVIPATSPAQGNSGQGVDNLQSPNGRAIPQWDSRADLPSMGERYPLAHTLTGHTEAVVSVRFSRDGGHVASASGDATARLWNVGTGQAEQSPLNHRGSGVNDVGWSRDGRMLATVCDDATVRVWDVRFGRCVRLLKGHKHHVMSCCFSPSDGILATAGYDETIRLWCMRTGAVIRIIPAHSDPIMALDFSSDVCAPLLASASLDGIW